MSQGLSLLAKRVSILPCITVHCFAARGEQINSSTQCFRRRRRVKARGTRADVRAEQVLIIQRYLSLFIIRFARSEREGRDMQCGGIGGTGRTRDKQVRGRDGGGEEGNANFAVGNLIISFRAGEFKDFIKSRLKCRRRVSTRLKNFITLFTTFLSRLSVSSFSSALLLFSLLSRARARQGKETGIRKRKRRRRKRKGYEAIKRTLRDLRASTASSSV